MKRRRRSQRGFTLVELMVSLVLFSFAVAGVLAVAVSMAQGYREQRQIVDTESNARGALDFIADSLRMASPGVLTGVVFSQAGTTMTIHPDDVAGVAIEDTMGAGPTCPQGSVIVNDGTGLNGSDVLQVIYASGPVVTSLQVAWTAASTTLTVVDTTNLAAGDNLLLTDGTDGRIVRVQTVTSATTVDLEPYTCTVTDPSVQPNYPIHSLVLRVNRARFYLQDNTASDNVSTALMMDPDSNGTMAAEPLADYIEDFQVSVGIDNDNDGALAPTEWAYSGVVGTPSPMTDGMGLRAIRISLVARAAKQLVATSPSYQKPVLENHNPGAAYDAYRRRTLHTTVEIRNFGGSP